MASLASSLVLEVDVSTAANPGTWLSILGDSVSVKITRGGQPDGVLDSIEPGTMTVTVLSAAVDPTQDDRVRPGAAVRLYVADSAAEHTVFTGRLDDMHADYTARKLDPDARPRVTLTAFDAVAELGRERHPYNYRGTFSSKAKAIMQGSAVPYVAGDDPTSTAILSARDNTARWTQLELARNSHPGAAVWVDRFGVLHAEPAPTTGALYVDASAEAFSFTGLEVTFGSKALVNALDLSRDNRDELEPPRNYGTYINAASVAEWGQVGQGIEIVDGVPSTLARYYLERTATPKVAPARLEFDAERTSSVLALLADVYDLVQIRNAAGVDSAAWWQIIGLDHEITPQAWRVALTLRAPATAESITVTNPPAGPDTGPVDHLPGPPRPSEPAAVSRLGAVQISWDGLAATGAELGAEFIYAEVWQAGDPPRMVGRISAETVVVVTDLPYNTEQVFTLVAVDRNGHRSAPSDPVYVTVAPIVDTDLIGEIIDGANIVPGTINAADTIIGNSITGNLIQAGTIAGDKLKANSIDAGKIAAGAIDGMTITGATVRAGTIVTGDRETAGDPSATGVYMSSGGYLNILSGGERVLTVNPYTDQGRYFMVGDSGGSGGYMRYNVAGAELTVQGSFEVNGTFRAAPRSGHGIRIDADGRFRIYADGQIVHQVVPHNTNWQETVAAYYVGLNARGGLFTDIVSNDDVATSLQMIGRGANGDVSMIQLGSNSGGGYVRARAIWTNTGGSSGNVYTNDSGVLYRVSSATRYKINIQPAEPRPGVLELEPVTWYDKAATERYAGYLDTVTRGDAVEDDELDTIDELRQIPGLLAEDVEQHLGPQFCQYGTDDDGNPTLEGILYDRLIVALLPVVRDLAGRIDSLERENGQHE